MAFSTNCGTTPKNPTIGTFATTSSRSWQRFGDEGIGISLSDVKNHAFVGLSLDLYNVAFLTFGYHVSTLTRLDTTGGAEVGMPIPGGGTDVPTTTEPKAKPFYAVSIDLRAAAALFGKIVRAAGTN